MPTSSTRTSNRKRSPAASGARGDIRIGISGWRYAPWRGRFYPAGLTQRNELAFASRMLPSIEAWSRGHQVGDARLASDVAARRGKRDVYCYFDNDMKVHAPYDAAHLAKRLGLVTGFGPDDSSIDEAASALPKKKASRRE